MAISSYLKTFPNFMVLGNKLIIREKIKRTHKDLVALHNLLSAHILENDVDEFHFFKDITKLSDSLIYLR